MEEENEIDKFVKNDSEYKNKLFKSIFIKDENINKLKFYGSNKNNNYIILIILFMLLCFMLIFMNFVLFNIQFVFLLISPYIFILYIHYYYKPEIKPKIYNKNFQI